MLLLVVPLLTLEADARGGWLSTDLASVVNLGLSRWAGHAPVARCCGSVPLLTIQRSGIMATYVILATFTDQGIKTAKDSPKRAEAFKQMAKTFGITVKEIFWTQGRYDIVLLTEAPDELTATALNLSLGALGNIRTESLRAFSADEMATIVSKMI
jgi:uncharacterized protein with GYD domain